MSFKNKNRMTYTGHENHSITLSDAAAMTKNFRSSLSDPSSIIAEYFGGDAIRSILAQTGCVGIRIYYALDATNVSHLVISGVDINGNDLCNGVLAEKGLGCPAYCSANNPLNS